MCCVHVCLQLSQLTRPAAMFVFPVQVSSPSSLLLRLSYEAEGQRNERQGGKAHSDLWYEISSLSTVGNFHICAYDFSLLFFVSAEDMDGKTEDEIEMMKAMGFASFGTTKVREHNDCFVLCSHKEV